MDLLRGFRCILLVVGISLAQCLPYLTTQDINALRKVFSSAVQSRSDLVGVHFGAVGLKLLGDTVPDAAGLCKYAQSTVEQNNVESLYHASGLAVAAGNCKLSVPQAEKELSAAVSSERSTQDVYYAATALKNLGLKVDNAKLDAALKEIIKTEDSATSLGYAFHAALLLGGDLKAYVDRIEDTIAQADQVDGKYQQFEGGLSVTAMIIAGVYSLADKANKTPNIKADEAVKFANYLMSRRGVQISRPAYHLLVALKLLTTNKFHVPVSVSLASSVALSKSEPAVAVRICNLLGESVGPLSVTVESATHVPTSGVVLNRQPMAAAPGDKTSTLYQLTFLDAKKEKGFYKLLISAGSQKDKRLVGTQGAEVLVKVMTEIQVAGAEISVVDREQSSTANSIKASPPSKISQVIDADFHQKLLMKFTVSDKNSAQPVTVHQAFVVFVHEKSNQEIIFVAEADSAKTYKFDADLQKSAKDFDFLSGKYRMLLILGDATVSNPLHWHVADFNLKLGKAPDSKGKERISYQKKPEITHLFNQPEKRPPQVISTVFTALCLSPILIMLILWLRIGVNISNFPFSLWAIGFHFGLAGVFGLYFLFWLQFNMFQTLKMLAGIGGLTFLCGNAMLRGIAERKKAKTE